MNTTIDIQNPDAALQKIIDTTSELDAAILAFTITEHLQKWAADNLDERGVLAATTAKTMVAALVELMADDAGVDGLTDELGRLINHDGHVVDGEPLALDDVLDVAGKAADDGDVGR